MRVLILTKIFPNRVEPTSAPFNRKQFAALSQLCETELLATIPWFPGARALRRWSDAGRLTRVPARDEIEGMRVRHPRFLYLPRVGHELGGALYAASLAPVVLAYRGQVDVVLGAWAYPDGYAALLLAKLLGVPAVLKLHGSDINVLGDRPGLRRRLCWALSHAARVVAVSRPLAERARFLGARADRIDLVPNGVDRVAFQPRDRASARRQLGRPQHQRTVLYVGHLSERKGAFDLLRAFAARRAELSGVDLVLVGNGAGAAACRQLAQQLGVSATFVGAQAHAAIPLWLAACDLLCLPSWSEGVPNVVIEALSSGRPVVATAVGGIPDVVGPEAGELVAPRRPAELASALLRVLSRPHDAERIARSLERPDWEGSARLLHAALSRALDVSASEAA